MRFQLYSIEQAPRSVPIWPALLDDLCQPPPERLAKVLGLSVRTVRRYNQAGSAPRAVCLALFWLTSWGRSHIDAQAVNDARLAVAYARSLQDRLEALEALVQHLQAISDTGAANDPVSLPPSAPRRRPSRPAALPSTKL